MWCFRHPPECHRTENSWRLDRLVVGRTKLHIWTVSLRLNSGPEKGIPSVGPCPWSFLFPYRFLLGSSQSSYKPKSTDHAIHPNQPNFLPAYEGCRMSLSPRRSMGRLRRPGRSHPLGLDRVCAASSTAQRSRRPSAAERPERPERHSSTVVEHRLKNIYTH